jgi:hypothetical protein
LVQVVAEIRKVHVALVLLVPMEQKQIAMHLAVNMLATLSLAQVIHAAVLQKALVV